MRQTGDKMWGKGGGEEGEAKRNERNKGLRETEGVGARLPNGWNR